MKLYIDTNLNDNTAALKFQPRNWVQPIVGREWIVRDTCIPEEYWYGGTVEALSPCVDGKVWMVLRVAQRWEVLLYDISSDQGFGGCERTSSYTLAVGSFKAHVDNMMQFVMGFTGKLHKLDYLMSASDLVEANDRWERLGVQNLDDETF